MQPTGPDGANHAQSLWEIRGPVPAAKISPQYRLATALVALAMILLPVIYVGIIAFIGWEVYQYAIGFTPTTGRRGGISAGSIILYLAPIVAGSIVVLFMIKPLFHRRARTTPPRPLKREEEPELFAFIEKICDLVRAPRPKRVFVDLQVNASASLTHGIWSVLTRNLTLTIGLPLASGLNVREFGGVLAHEFGHFAQGAGMGTTYIVRMISMWFSRVVYERDSWDATLDAWARESDWRLMILLQIVRATVWLVRRILWALMMVGHFLSCVLMRQMEFDADHYEIQTAGTKGFISTARQLRLLGVGAHITHGKQEEAFASKRLVDDLAGWILHETKSLSPEVREKVVAAAADEKTHWLHTHPSDSERIARAEKAQCDGVLQGEEPAQGLFRDFSALSIKFTRSLYRDAMGISIDQVALQPLAKMTAESEEYRRGSEAIDKFFHGLLTIHTPVFLRPADLETPVALLPVPEIPPKLSEELKQDNPGMLKLRSLVNLAQPGLEEARVRLIAGLQQWLRQPDHSPETVAQMRLLVFTLSRMEPLMPTIHNLSARLRQASTILMTIQGQADENTYHQIKSASDEVRRQSEHVLQSFGETPYAFEHAGGRVPFAKYLDDDEVSADPIMAPFIRGDAIVNRFLGTYHRAIVRLTLLALSAQEATPAPPGSPA